MLDPKCIYRKCIFAKCTRLTCLLSFASLFFRFCEVEVKWKEYKEHRENCFTENLDKIKGFKEAPLPKECPKDENHILYQWPDRKSEKCKIFSFPSHLRKWVKV